MAIIDKIDKLSGTDTRSRNITQAIDKYSGKGPSKNIDDAVKKLDETGTLGKMGIKERIDHLSNAQTMSRDITQAIDRHTGKGPSRNIEEALKWWEEPTPPGPVTEAYAVFDSADGSLVFFRDEPGKYSEEEVIDTKTYYTGVETGSHGWSDNSWDIMTVQFDDVIKPTSTEEWFFYCANLATITGMDKLDTSNVTSMRYMFAACATIPSLDISGFNTSKVTDMNGMFYSCSSVQSLDLASFNTSLVTDMSDMFRDCETLTLLNVSGFDTSNVTTMSSMFEHCIALPSLNVSGFSTSNVTNMFHMFRDCYELLSLDVSGFNTSNVTNMDGMFSDCQKITSLDVSGFDTSRVTSMSSTFNGCRQITSLDVSGFNTTNVSVMNAMFYGCEALTSLDVSGFDTSNVYDMEHMFHYCQALTSLDISGFDTSKVTTMVQMFADCSKLTMDVTINDLSKYLPGMFYDAATVSPAKITLYGEGSVTSADINNIITTVKTHNSDSNIVNGMLSSNVVFDEDVVFDFEGVNPPSVYSSALTPLIPIEDTSLTDDKYTIRISNPQMRQYLGGDPMYGEWQDAICTAHRYITSADNRIVLSVDIRYIVRYGGNSWNVEFSHESGDGYVPTKFHLYVEKKD